jgi:flagellar biosynthesis component FlhA
MSVNDEQTAAEPSVAGPQTESAVTSVEAAAPAGPHAAPTPPILSDEQRRLLVAVLDRIVPAREGLAGAGGLGVDRMIERTLALTPSLRRLFLEGLTEIQVASARQRDGDFLALDAATQESVLRAVEAASPAFFAALVEHTYRGYYILPEVHAAIGYPSQPPQPAGLAMPAFREELLTIQRTRAPFWRRTS